MAKMFYTLEEAKNVLGRSEDDIKQYARDGRLREFRDGPRLMFKADQVEQLRSELTSGGDHVDLGVSDSGGMIDLVDTTAASGTSVTLADSTGQGTSFGSKMGTGAGMKTKEDTALAADLGLSGTATGIPSPSRIGTSGTGLTGLSGTGTGSRAGINVFGTEEHTEGVDPSAQTAISAFKRRISISKASDQGRAYSTCRASAMTRASAPCLKRSVLPAATRMKPALGMKSNSMFLLAASTAVRLCRSTLKRLIRGRRPLVWRRWPRRSLPSLAFSR